MSVTSKFLLFSIVLISFSACCKNSTIDPSPSSTNETTQSSTDIKVKEFQDLLKSGETTKSKHS
jgi:hypothetical protein